MSTVSSLPGGKVLVAVKGAPETIKHMLTAVPDDYDDTFKWFTRKGSRVLALGTKEIDSMTIDKARPFLMRFSDSFHADSCKIDQQASPRPSRVPPQIFRIFSLPLSVEG